VHRLLLASALALAGCLDTAPAAPPAAADAEAFALLEAVDRSAVAAAFARLDGVAYRAEQTVMIGDSSEDGRETTTLVHADGALRTTAHQATGSLAGGEAPEDPAGVRDPIATALSDDPPFLDPAARGAYAVAILGDTLVGGARFRLVEAVLADTGRELGVRRVWAAVDGTGRVASVEVERTAASVLYDETSRVRVDLAPVGGVWLPRRIETDTRTDVPLSPPVRLRTTWTLTPTGGDA